jgi:hypothetical protein
MINWNVLSEYKITEKAFYDYFKWQKYDAYLNVFYTKSATGFYDIEIPSFDEVCDFFESHKIFINIIADFKDDYSYLYNLEIVNVKLLTKLKIYNCVGDKDDVKNYAIKIALKELENNLTSNDDKLKYKYEKNIENNVKEFFNSF